MDNSTFMEKADRTKQLGNARASLRIFQKPSRAGLKIIEEITTTTKLKHNVQTPRDRKMIYETTNVRMRHATQKLDLALQTFFTTSTQGTLHRA
jgi:hypothetical protein